MARASIKILLTGFVLGALLLALAPAATAQDPWFPGGNKGAAKNASGKGCATWKEFKKVKKGMRLKQVRRTLSARSLGVVDALEPPDWRTRVFAYSFKPCKRSIYSDFYVSFRQPPGRSARVVFKGWDWAW